ncbi:MAG: hypothetical protein WBV21_12895 [Desulfobacterales bacterium]
MPEKNNHAIILGGLRGIALDRSDFALSLLPVDQVIPGCLPHPVTHLPALPNFFANPYGRISMVG